MDLVSAKSVERIEQGWRLKIVTFSQARVTIKSLDLQFVN
jgi:hypothetical protein